MKFQAMTIKLQAMTCFVFFDVVFVVEKLKNPEYITFLYKNQVPKMC